MAVTVLKHAEKYAGTHAERLAMDVSRVSLGSTFFEWDTSELFTFSPTGWVDKIGQVAGSMQLSGSNVEQDGSIKTTMTTALDSDYDSIDVDKMGKGGVTTVHSAIADTATSDEVDCRGYNAILVEAGVFSAAENWTFKVQGCMVSGGTFVDWYEMANTGIMTLMSYQCNAARGFIFKGIPDYVKIVATRDGGASAVTVKVQPLNV